MSNDYPHSDLTEQIIGCALSVHRILGPGLLESAYQGCLAAEFRYQGIAHKSQVCIPIFYRDEIIPVSYKMDFVVHDRIVVELKAVESIAPIITAQILTYLRLTHLPVALLINFNAYPLKAGIRRFANTNPPK